MAGVHSLVLAGGISNRMGFPKALMPFGQSYFLHRIYETLVAAETDPVYIVINTGLYACLKSPHKEFPRGRFVQNPDPARGQIHSLKLGLGAARQDGAHAVVVALVDQPAIQVGTILELVAAYRRDPNHLLIATYGGKTGHPILIPSGLFDAFLDAPEGQTARDIIARHADCVELVETRDPQVVADIDSPEDLARLHELETEID